MRILRHYLRYLKNLHPCLLKFLFFRISIIKYKGNIGKYGAQIQSDLWPRINWDLSTALKSFYRKLLMRIILHGHDL